MAIQAAALAAAAVCAPSPRRTAAQPPSHTNTTTGRRPPPRQPARGATSPSGVRSRSHRSRSNRRPSLPLVTLAGAKPGPTVIASSSSGGAGARLSCSRRDRAVDRLSGSLSEEQHRRRPERLSNSMWAWGNDQGGWNLMPDATSQHLEATFQGLSPTDDARVEYTVDQGHRIARYEVNTRKMTQKNLATGFKRAVRRFQAPGSGPPAQVWSWESDLGGQFSPCDPDISDWLSLCRAKGWSAARYWTDSKTQYEASFAAAAQANGPGLQLMTQRNLSTGRVRGLVVDVAPSAGGNGQPASVPALVNGVLANCNDVTARVTGGDDDGDDEEELCIICHEGFGGAPGGDRAALELPDCGPHAFHRDCLKAWLQRSLTCPVCSKSYGPRIGNMPPGDMTVARYACNTMSLPGHEAHGTIVITYSFRSGTQGVERPHPGVRYHGTTRTCYLPDSPEGRELLALLQRAWQQRLTFTVGRSITTGADNVVVWNGIHHKTSPTPGPYGYPDPGYLARLRAELASKGIQ